MSWLCTDGFPSGRPVPPEQPAGTTPAPPTGTSPGGGPAAGQTGVGTGTALPGLL